MKTHILTVVILVCVLAGWLPAQQTSVGVITLTQGDVQLRPRGQAKETPARLAELIAAGTRIRTGTSGRAQFIFCPKSITAEVKPDSELVLNADGLSVVKGGIANEKKISGCRIPRTRVSANSDHIGGTILRGQKTLALLSPLDGVVFDFPVRLRWKAVEGATSYRIEILDSQGSRVWNAASSALRAETPAGKSFAPGLYRWRVIAEEASEMVASASSFFRVPSDSDRSRVEEMRRNCPDKADSSLASCHLLLAFLYEELGARDLTLAEYRKVAQVGNASEWLQVRIRDLQKQLGEGPER